MIQQGTADWEHAWSAFWFWYETFTRYNYAFLSGYLTVTEFSEAALMWEWFDEAIGNPIW